LIAQALLSWFNPRAPLYDLVGRMTDPLLRPFRRIVPPISGIDLTPLIALLMAQIVLILI
jgi:YggT family protein